jgi:hypothetical protein
MGEISDADRISIYIQAFTAFVQIFAVIAAAISVMVATRASSIARQAIDENSKIESERRSQTEFDKRVGALPISIALQWELIHLQSLAKTAAKKIETSGNDLEAILSVVRARQQFSAPVLHEYLSMFGHMPISLALGIGRVRSSHAALLVSFNIEMPGYLDAEYEWTADPRAAGFHLSMWLDKFQAAVARLLPDLEEFTGQRNLSWDP